MYSSISTNHTEHFQISSYFQCNNVGLFYSTMYLLGYIPKDNRLYLGDKDLNVVSYSLLLSVLEYQTAVMREDFETAKQVPSL